MTVNLSGIVVTFLAPYPDLSATTPHGAWFATLASSLGLVLALACAIPMCRPEHHDTTAPAPTPPAPVSIEVT